MIAPFLALGIAVAVVLLKAMLENHVTVRLGHYHIAYSIGLKPYRDIGIFGLANLVAEIVL